MSSRYRWAWFVLACFCAAALLWTHRHQYAACDTDGCVAINRWTGAIVFEPAAEVGFYSPEGAVVRREGRGRQRSTPDSWRADAARPVARTGRR